VLGCGCFVEITNFHEIFTLPLAKSNFHASAFALSILGATLFKFLLFTLLLAKSNFHASAFTFSIFRRNAFQFSAGKIQLSRFCSFTFSILSATLFKFLLFTLLLASSNFHASAL
jgi:uncharacterized membrane protein YccF (DUF307 family)